MTTPLAVLTPDQLATLVRAAVAEVLDEMRPCEAPRDVLTRAEAAALLRVSVGQLDRLARRDADPLPYRYAGDSRRFLRAEVLAWIDRQRGAAT